MENKDNNSNKPRKNFKKEGFYVVLFVCLCVVAAVAAITISNNKKVAINPPAINEELSENNLNNNDNPDNALLVENIKEKDETVAKKPTIIEVPKSLAEIEKKETTSVSKPLNLEFINPVEGTLARAYSEIPTFFATGSDEKNTRYCTNFGIDIKTKLGAKVCASADGIVEYVGEELKHHGTTVVINHENGLMSVYSNLDNDVKVKKDDRVKKGDSIGKVGNTTYKTRFEEYGSHLHFSMLQGKGSYEELSKSNSFIEPSKYVHYEKIQEESVQEESMEKTSEGKVE